MNIGDDEHNALAEADLKKAMDVSGNKKQKDNIMWLR